MKAKSQSLAGINRIKSPNVYQLYATPSLTVSIGVRFLFTRGKA